MNAPVIVSVSGGQTTGGVDISVPTPAGQPAVNVRVLGVAPLGAGGSAFNTGGVISRGTTMKVLLFGPGLTADATITIGGPNDIGISNVRAITSTTGMPGIAFDATVPGNAAPGARTVYIKLPNTDISAFAGGLEVQ